MAAEVLDKLDTLFHLLPELDMPVHTCSDNEVSLGRYYVCDYVTMHVTFFIAFRIRQVVQVQFLIFEYCEIEELLIFVGYVLRLEN